MPEVECLAGVMELAYWWVVYTGWGTVMMGLGVLAGRWLARRQPVHRPGGDVPSGFFWIARYHGPRPRSEAHGEDKHG